MLPSRFVRHLAVLLFVLLVGCGGGGDDAVLVPGGLAPGTDAGPIAGTLYDYVLTRLNQIRAAEAPAAAPFVRTAGLDTYAQTGTTSFMTTAVAHGHFDNVNILPSCPPAVAPFFADVIPGDPLAGCAAAARENQGVAGGGATQGAVDTILGAFLAEKPFPACSTARGHYDAMIDPKMNHVGIGLTLSTDGRLWMTIDFCD